jgi:VCBS repeat-containing protein
VAAGEATELADGAPGEGTAVHSASGSVDFIDIDTSDPDSDHSVSVTPADAGYLGTLTSTLTDVPAGDATGQVSWTFKISDAAIDHLGAFDSLTQTYGVTIDDGHGGTATQDVTITIAGTNDGPDAVDDFFGGGSGGGESISEVKTTRSNRLRSAR